MLFRSALRMAYQSAKATNIPVIGCGGISSAEDVLEFMIAGAHAVQVGTATFVNPTSMPAIIRDLEARLLEMGVGDVNDIVGTVIDGEQEAGVVFMEAAP